MSGNKHLPLKLAAPARLETADGWSINLPWARHGDDDPYAEAEAFAPVLVDMVNSYASSQAEIERLRDVLQSIKTHGYLANIPVDQGWGSSGKKPASKDVWCLPRHMLNDLDAALGSKE